MKCYTVIKTTLSQFDKIVAVKRSEVGKRYQNISFGCLYLGTYPFLPLVEQPAITSTAASDSTKRNEVLIFFYFTNDKDIYLQ